MRLKFVSFKWPAKLLCALAVISHTCAVSAQTVEKVADLNFASLDGVGLGGYGPLARLTKAGSNLWFTTDKGGAFDAGTISRFDLITREVVEAASLDNNTGRGSESALLVIGDEGYFTTKSGGTGNAGTIAKINLGSGAINVLFNFPENSAENRANGLHSGAAPRASLTHIGEELWTTTSLGGTSNRGTIVRFNLTNGVTSLVANLDGPALGGQAFGGFTRAESNAWFFTTFTGGSSFGASGLSLGAGTLGRLSFDAGGQPVLGKVADMTPGFAQFPALEPTLVGTNALYFGTTGPNSEPGAIIRYDLDTGTWTNLFSFTTNAATAAAFGTRPGYSGFVEWLGELYFLTRQGGDSNLGVVAKFNLASNTVVKLADFDGQGGLALGRATGIFDNTGTIVEESGRCFLYYAIPSGGANNRGTILRVALPPPPVVATLQPTEQNLVNLSWTGGYPPFTVQHRGSLEGGNWTNLVSQLTNRTVTLVKTGCARYFQILSAQP